MGLGPRKNRHHLGKASDGAQYYYILVSALVQAERRIRTFHTGPDWWSVVPLYVVYRGCKTRSAQPVNFHDDSVTAFSEVEELVLGFATYGRAKTVKLFANISGMPAILGAMNHLKV